MLPFFSFTCSRLSRSWSVCWMAAPSPAHSLRDRSEILDDHGLPPSPREDEISLAVHAKASRQTGTQRAVRRDHCCHVEMKSRNPRFGCRRIAQQLSFVFGLEIDKDVVRRVLAKHYRPDPGAAGPSWLTFLGHSKDSLWSLDLFAVSRWF